MKGNPVARSEGLLVEELGDELIICDIERDVVHSLNGPAAVCWKALDGAIDIVALSAEAVGDVRADFAGAHYDYVHGSVLPRRQRDVEPRPFSRGLRAGTRGLALR